MLQGPGGSTGGLVKNGGGTLILTSSVNTFIGPTTISNGTLQLGTGNVGQDGTLASSPVINNNTALVYNLLGNQTYSGAIGGNGSVTKVGNGILTLSGSNTYNGPTTISGGGLAVGGTIANSLVTVTSGGSLSGGGNLTGLVANNVVVTGGGALAFGNSSTGLTLGSGLTLGNSGPGYGAINYANLNVALGLNGIGPDQPWPREQSDRSSDC